MEDIEKKVKQAIRKVVRMADEEIPMDSPLVNIGVDSFAGIELVFALEDAFDIKISDEETSQMRTVRDIVCAINQRLMKKP